MIHQLRKQYGKLQNEALGLFMPRAESLARLLHRRRGEDRASHLRHFDEQNVGYAARGPRERQMA